MGQAELQVLGIVYQEAEWPGRAQKAQKRDDVGQMEMQRADKVAFKYHIWQSDLKIKPDVYV